MAGSTVAVVKAALVALLEARPGLAGVKVEYGHPGDSTEKELIYFGRAIGTQDINVMREGRKKRDEEYVLDAHIEVLVEGGTQQEADDRALELTAELETALADDPRATLGADVVNWIRVSRTELLPAFAEKGRASLMTVGLTVRARLL